MRELCIFGLMAAFLAVPVDLLAENWEPMQQPLEKYEHIWESSPFVAAAVVTPQGESIVQRYALTGFARIGDAEVVFLFDRQGLNRFSLAKGKPVNGVELLELREDGDVNQLGAKIRADGEIAEISYDASLAGSANQPAGKGGGPVQPAKNVQRRKNVEKPKASLPTIASPTVQTNGAGSAPLKPRRVIRRKPIKVK